MTIRERNAKIRKIYSELNGEVTNRDLCAHMHIDEIILRLEHIGTRQNPNYCIIDDLEKNVLRMWRTDLKRYCNKECDSCIKYWLNGAPVKHSKK